MKKVASFTRGDAEVLMEAHDIQQMLDSPEEREMLMENHPDLLIAYERLRNFSKGWSDAKSDI